MPRAEVTALTTEDSIADAARSAAQTGYTRLPLCEPEGDLDAAIRVVHLVPLLQATLEGRPIDLRKLATPILPASEVTLLDELLEQMRESRGHMALVSNEYGTAVGIVTLEDILEEIVGDIRDEYDPAEERLVEPLGGSAVRVQGDTPLHAISNELDLTLEERREATLGGHLTELLGRAPTPGETLTLDSWQATIDDVDGAAVVSVTLQPANPQSREAGTGQREL